MSANLAFVNLVSFSASRPSTRNLPVFEAACASVEIHIHTILGYHQPNTVLAAQLSRHRETRAPSFSLILNDFIRKVFMDVNEVQGTKPIPEQAEHIHAMMKAAARRCRCSLSLR
jgi:hypothetical protein